ncbi:class IV aminotransferase [Nitritalea halalkaliphila LW7]|uniref:Class IV aminotransferase n=1 Tax=Nitritalea halalkaliphila LW7 TaxID=1189621 RepID=I5C4E0_9BACT|nr:class IV aminotransferase [Nitritalea halalkaliphila LW7]
MKPYCFALDRIAPVEEARIHASDIAVIRGYGIFDFLRTQEYCPLFLSDYLDRFIASAQHTRLPLAYTKDELRDIIYTLIAKNDLREGGIRLVLTGGRSENHFAPGQSSALYF